MFTGDKAYKYTAKLLQLDECAEMSECSLLPSHLCTVTTPVNINFWEQYLSNHEDRQFTYLLVKGLKTGFRIGFQRKMQYLYRVQNPP